MSISQNCAFTVEAEKGAEFDHPKGLFLVRVIQHRLTTQGWSVSDFDNWRDCGWRIDCEKDKEKIEVTIAELPEENRWMLQAAPKVSPGFVGRLFGQAPSAPQASVLTLAKEIDQILKDKGINDMLWCWDDFPSPSNSTHQPE